MSLLFLSSTYLYTITGKTECFWIILTSITAGSLLCSLLVISAIFFGNKIYEKINLKEQNRV
jgi:hypothetical protein